MANFNEVKLPISKSSKHNLGNTWSGSLQWGALTPIYCKPVVPGEHISYNPSILIQSPAFASLTFGRVKVTQHSFFVPSRLLWTDFQSFIVGGDNGRQVFTPPYAYLGDYAGVIGLERTQHDNLYAVSTLIHDKFVNLDYYPRGTYSTLINGFGLAPYHQSGVSPTDSWVNTSYQQLPISLMPFRAYQKIWWDWYRDSTLVPESQKSQYIKTDGGRHPFMIGHESEDVLMILNRPFLKEVTTRKICYDKDYFTTARTQPQSGTPSLVPVEVPSSGFVKASLSGGSLTGSRLVDSDGDSVIFPSFSVSDGLGVSDEITSSNNDLKLYNYSVSNATLTVGRASSLLSGANQIGQFSIETLRLGNALQRFLERSNVTGTRPIAQLLGRFGVAPSAARLDMAELIGGESRTLDIIQVINTAKTSEGELADRGAFGKLHFNGGKQTYHAVEHGWFISLIAIEPIIEYCDGVDRMFTMQTKEDYFLSEYENLGYDAVANYELFISLRTDIEGQDADALDSFGFNPRYSWMKWKRSVLAGDFVRLNTRTDNLTWHTYRRFDNVASSGDVPVLNPSFVELSVNDGFNNWNRMFDNVTSDYDPFKVNIFNDCVCTLPMEGFAEPALANVYEMDGRRVTIPYGGVRL